jgi:hypothetical protein
MATPTDQQQIRATLRRAERNIGADKAAWLALSQAVQIVGAPAVRRAIVALGAIDALNNAQPLPPTARRGRGG